MLRVVDCCRWYLNAIEQGYACRDRFAIGGLSKEAIAKPPAERLRSEVAMGNDIGYFHNCTIPQAASYAYLSFSRMSATRAAASGMAAERIASDICWSSIGFFILLAR